MAENKRTLTDAELRQRRLAARKHGIRALELSGPDSLEVEPEKVAALHELREMVRSEPGRRDLREELTARVALIVEMGFGELIKWTDQGRPLFQSPVIKRASTWVAELRRLLDSFPMDYDDRDITDILSGNHEQD